MKKKLEEIKKELYKQKPEAVFINIKNGIAYYYADISDQRVYFDISTSDMGEANFNASMDAKLLIRWIRKDDQ